MKTHCYTIELILSMIVYQQNVFGTIVNGEVVVLFLEEKKLIHVYEI